MPKTVHSQLSASHESSVFFQRLHACGLRPTSVRIGILQALKEFCNGCLTAEEIYLAVHEGGVNTSLSTIYRALRELEQKKLLVRIWNEQGIAMYRIGQDDADDMAITIVFDQGGRSFSFEDRELLDHLLASLERRNLHPCSQAATVHIRLAGSRRK